MVHRIIKIFDAGKLIDTITIQNGQISVETSQYRLTFLSNINQYLKENVNLTAIAIKSALNSIMNKDEMYVESSYDSWGRLIK